MTAVLAIETQALYHRVKTAFDDAFNAALLADYERLKGALDTRKTHFFGGRYENIYVGRQHSKKLDQLLTLAEQVAETITGETPLCVGFWFNEMPPGHLTTAHTHDDDDELLSAVYYVRTPENSGDLVLGEGESRQVIQPQSGSMILFLPDLIHEVEINQSNDTRVSIGMNFGRAKLFVPG